MYHLTENGDWTNDFDYTQSNVADIQPGHSVSGTVGGTDAGDLIRVSLAYDQPYTFTLEGDGVSFEMLDDGTDAGATIDGNTMTYTANTPRTFTISGCPAAAVTQSPCRGFRRTIWRMKTQATGAARQPLRSDPA